MTSATVPIDRSWESEVCETYNPQHYVEKNLIIQKPPPNLTKKQKKEFRRQERLRFQLIEEQRLIKCVVHHQT